MLWSSPTRDEAVDNAGRAKELAYQTLLIAKEQKLDIEKALFANQGNVVGSNSVARKTGGVPSWLITNVDFQSGASGANPTGDGTDARTDDGTPTAFSQAKFDGVMQSIWEEGGKPDTVYLSAFQMNVALGFTGNNNQRSAVQAGDERVIKSLAVYVTPWGSVEFMPSPREPFTRRVYFAGRHVGMRSIARNQERRLGKKWRQHYSPSHNRIGSLLEKRESQRRDLRQHNFLIY